MPQPALVPKKILIASTFSGRTLAESHFLSPSLGPIRVVSFLCHHGHDAEYIDPNLFVATGVGSSLEEKLTEKAWDIIGFSVLADTLENDIRNIYLARRLNPTALIVCGGMEAQFNYQTLLDKTPCTMVVLGEGEIPMLLLANGEPPHTIPGVVFKTPARPLSRDQFDLASRTIPWETIPYETYWDYYVQKYGGKLTPQTEQEIHTVRVSARNRCPIGCRFCSSTNQLSWSSEGPVPVIGATEDTLIDIVDRLVAAHPRLRTIYFTDDDFCINRLSVIRFCRKVVERNYQNLSFLSFARVTDLTEELMGWLSRAGFRNLIVGVESFSQPVLDELGKRCRVSDVHAALQLSARFNVNIHFNVLLITPGSTLDDIEISVDNAIHYVSRPDKFTGQAIASIWPLKGSELFEMHSAFETEVVMIEGTTHRLKRDRFILANDPIVRELQLRYIREVEAEVTEAIARHGIQHSRSSNVAVFRFQIMKRMIAEARQKYHLPPCPPDPVPASPLPASPLPEVPAMSSS